MCVRVHRIVWHTRAFSPPPAETAPKTKNREKWGERAVLKHVYIYGFGGYTFGLDTWGVSVTLHVRACVMCSEFNLNF